MAKAMVGVKHIVLPEGGKNRNIQVDARSAGAGIAKTT